MPVLLGLEVELASFDEKQHMVEMICKTFEDQTFFMIIIKTQNTGYAHCYASLVVQYPISVNS